MRLPQTITWKRGEANNNWEIVTTKRQEAHEATNMVERKQKDEENTDRKASKANRHNEELKRRREQSVVRLAGYHQIIDNCYKEIKYWKRTIAKDHERIRRQEHIRQEVISFWLDADLLRTEAHINCMSGLMEHET